LHPPIARQERHAGGVVGHIVHTDIVVQHSLQEIPLSAPASAIGRGLVMSLVHATMSTDSAAQTRKKKCFTIPFYGSL
jgi:hypothetical protein